jgi:riboflavin kinase
LFAAADHANVTLEITGVDLSPAMMEHAARSVVDLAPPHTLQLVTSDICQYCQTHTEDAYYHGIILNACFGNFWNSHQVLESLLLVSSSTTNSQSSTTICISHPLGASFVQKLHAQDPKTVPHVLPETTLEVLELVQGLPLALTSMQNDSNSYYLTTLQTCRAKTLSCLHRYRGIVDQGYGRGGKKLGVPTANLPASLFQNALESVNTGVYFGWAVLENNSQKIHKAVVNVGYSPTFEGQENPEKIIEAHLILEDNVGVLLDDFYGVPMRLQLIGFLRDEQKFASFPELIAQIHADVQDAKTSLDWMIPYPQLQDDDFLKVTGTTTWVGSGGGDDAASWEFVPMKDELQSIYFDKTKKV